MTATLIRNALAHLKKHPWFFILLVVGSAVAKTASLQARPAFLTNYDTVRVYIFILVCTFIAYHAALARDGARPSFKIFRKTSFDICIPVGIILFIINFLLPGLLGFIASYFGLPLLFFPAPSENTSMLAILACNAFVDLTFAYMLAASAEHDGLEAIKRIGGMIWKTKGMALLVIVLSVLVPRGLAYYAENLGEASVLPLGGIAQLISDAAIPFCALALMLPATERMREKSAPTGMVAEMLDDRRYPRHR